MKECYTCKRQFNPSSNHKNCPKCRSESFKVVPCVGCGNKIRPCDSGLCSACYLISPSNFGEYNPNWKGGIQQNIESAISILGSVCVHCLAEGVLTQQDLQFDHIDPDTKLFNIRRWTIKDYSVEEFWIEVTKCQLLCITHHSRKTANDQSYGPSKGLLTRERNSLILEAKQVRSNYIREQASLGRTYTSIAAEVRMSTANVSRTARGLIWK